MDDDHSFIDLLYEESKEFWNLYNNCSNFEGKEEIAMEFNEKFADIYPLVLELKDAEKYYKDSLNEFHNLFSSRFSLTITVIFPIVIGIFLFKVIDAYLEYRRIRRNNKKMIARGISELEKLRNWLSIVCQTLSTFQ